MTDARDALRSWVRGRLEMGDPELFVAAGEREGLLDRARSARRGRRTRGPETPELERLSREGSAQEILDLPDMESLRRVAGSCVRCALHATRTHVVFADGPDRADVLCVGEAPGAHEDATGLPFVGPAGKLLDRLLCSVGFPRQEVFICNVLKCRPPGNRNPLPEEIEACSPFMLRQVELVSPRVIAAFGTFAAQTLLGTRESLGRLRGRTHVYRGYPLVVTYHPAALLRNPGWIRPTWEDMQRIRRIADDDAGVPSPSRSPEDEVASAAKPREPRAADQLVLGDSDG